MARKKNMLFKMPKIKLPKIKYPPYNKQMLEQMEDKYYGLISLKQSGTPIDEKQLKYFKKRVNQYRKKLKMKVI